MATDTNDTTRDPLDAHNAMAEKLYDKTPLAPTPGKFHTWTPARAAIDGRSEELYTRAGMNSSAVQEQRNTFDAIEKETGLPDVYVASLANATMDAILASTRVSDDPDADDIALIKQIEEGNRDSRERLATTRSRLHVPTSHWQSRSAMRPRRLRIHLPWCMTRRRP